MTSATTRLVRLAVIGAALGALLGAAAPTGDDKKRLAECRELVQIHRGMHDDASRITSELTIARELANRRVEGYRTLAKQLKGKLVALEGAMQIQRGALAIRLPASVLFDTGKATLKAEGQAALAEVAAALASAEGRDIVVEGHTDNVPVKQKNKAFSSNVELSGKRALAVVTALSGGGVPDGSLVPVAHGEHVPVAENTTDEGRATNRRVDILVMPRIDEMPVFSDRLELRPAYPPAAD